LVASSVPAFAAHPHYERLLREGTFALERGEMEKAARDLRLACFGLLEEPKRLAGCLTRLAVAQAADGDDEDFQETFRRIVEVQERFGAYQAADVDPETRQAFEDQVAQRIPAKILEVTPSFERLVQKAAEPAGTGPEDTAAANPAQPSGATEAAGGSPPPAETEPAAGDPVPAAPGKLTAEETATLDRARSLLKASKYSGDLEEPLRLARQVADTRPDSSEAQSLTAVIAYRASMWQEAVTYFHRAGDTVQNNPEMLFYLAVSLYETGDRSAAADALERCLPRIDKTPFVRSYRDKILGPPNPPNADGSP